MWLQRYELISKLIPENCSIIEFGAAGRDILKFITPRIYYPFDIQDMDLNQAFPVLKEKVDLVLAVGLIEYLDDPFEFLRTISHYSNKAIITHNPAKDKNHRYYKFKNRFFKLEFEKLISKSGWKYSSAGLSQGSQIYKLINSQLI